MVKLALTLVIAWASVTPACQASATRTGVYPVVDVQSGMLFGGTINGRWVDAEHLAPRLKGGERYRLY
ncbi:MAG: hypothetical protein M3Y13_13595, partial [Armatimonadota bacterium]|nr:hypothetical protein [Armatimonadota bacterium]